MTDNRRPFVNPSSEQEYLANLKAGTSDLEAIYARCVAAYPQIDLAPEEFQAAVVGAVNKYLVGYAKDGQVPATTQIHEFISELQSLDLFLTLACASGNEQAWWEFDRQYRPFIQRLANQLVARGMDANEIIDSVYTELYGTKAIEGVRQSKFKTYTGRGTLRGWLRTVISHAAVDLYRARQDEVPLEEWSRSGDEVPEGQGWRTPAHGSETSMLEEVARARYRSATCAALDESLATLDAHEKLLLLYYHVEGLKLREIARIVEAPTSSLRRWFQRRSKRAGNTKLRVHESTVMRWLDNVYKKVAGGFHTILKNKHGLNSAEIDICLEIATEDFGQGVNLNLEKTQAIESGEGNTGSRQIEGAS